MLSRAWACAVAAVLFAPVSWADNDDRDDKTIIIIDDEHIEEIRRETDDFSRDIMESIREALEVAREEMRRAGEEIHRDQREQRDVIRFRVEDRAELREALREAFRESQGALHEAGLAVRELMAQGIPGLGPIGPLLGAEPFFGDSGAGQARPVDEKKSAAGVRDIEIENIAGRIVVEGQRYSVASRF